MKDNYTILVTGGADFIGSNLIEQLLNLGNNIVSIDNFDNFYSKNLKLLNIQCFTDNKNYRNYEFDFNDTSKLDNVFKQHKIDFNNIGINL